MDTLEMTPQMTFDDLLGHIGGSGQFQIILNVMMFALTMFAAESIYINFVAAKLPHWCSVPDLENLTFSLQKVVAIPSDTQEDRLSTTSYSQCQRFNLNYSAYTREDFLTWNRTERIPPGTGLIDCPNGWTYDRSQFASSIVAEWDLVCGQAWLVPLVSTSYTGGMFVGAISAGLLSDKIGRRPVLVIYHVIKLAGGIFATLAPNYAAMMVARFIIGFGSTGVYLTAFVMVVEVCSGTARTVFGIGLGIGFSLGYMLIPGIAYFIRDFRKVQIVMAAPSIVGIALWWLIPESPRWLLVQGKYKEAEKVIKYMADVNGRPLPDGLNVKQIKLDEEKTMQGPKKTFLDLFRRPLIRKWTLVVFFHWFTDSLMYYALSLNSGSLAGDIFLNTFLLGLVEIPANIFCALGLQWRRLGRRLTCSFSLLLAGGASVISIPLVVTGAVPWLTTALAMVGKAAATVAFSGIYVYTGELFPTEVRNVAMGGASTFARVSGMAAPFVGGIMGDVWKGLPFLIYGFFGLLTGVLTLLLPETLGAPLCETIEDAERKMGKSGREVAPLDADRKQNIGSSSGTTAAPSSVKQRKKELVVEHDNPAFEGPKSTSRL